MAKHRIERSARVEAPPARVYGILADYREGHQRILPRPEFVAMDVEAGGVGAGTRIRVETRVLGRTQVLRFEVTEPEPGRVLEETDAAAGITTRFVVEPLDGGAASRVTILTERRAPGGPLGALERFVAGRILRRLYARELQNLARDASVPVR